MAAPAANADHHLVKIREVHRGTTVGPDAGNYIVLQSYAAGENLFTNHYVKTYNNGGEQSSRLLNTNGSALNQATYLVGNSGVTGSDSVPGDPLALDVSGAACYTDDNVGLLGIDCVSWGAFTGFVGGIPSPTGTPAATLGADQSLVRSITPGCATLLEGTDDTNNSAADFAIGAGSPRNSTTAPTEKACTTTPVVKKKKCKKKKKHHSASVAKKKKCKKKHKKH
jgi:hypothetical protein